MPGETRGIRYERPGASLPLKRRLFIVWLEEAWRRGRGGGVAGEWVQSNHELIEFSHIADVKNPARGHKVEKKTPSGRKERTYSPYKEKAK